MSTSSTFDAVVPDILTFRPDKDDPLDIPEDHQMENDGRQKVEEVRGKRIELIKTVISIIASRNINEAFEQLCCEALPTKLNTTSHSISYGLKG